MPNRLQYCVTFWKPGNWFERRCGWWAAKWRQRSHKVVRGALWPTKGKSYGSSVIFGKVLKSSACELGCNVSFSPKKANYYHGWELESVECQACWLSTMFSSHKRLICHLIRWQSQAEKLKGRCVLVTSAHIWKWTQKKMNANIQRFPGELWWWRSKVAVDENEG